MAEIVQLLRRLTPAELTAIFGFVLQARAHARESKKSAQQLANVCRSGRQWETELEVWYAEPVIIIGG